MTRIDPIAPDLLDASGDGVRLVGGRHKQTGRVVFPLPQGPDCELYERIHLASKGALWSWTVQRFRPKSPPYAGVESPESFKPYAVGYVELPGEIIVESRLVVDDLSSLKIGMPMELVAEPFARGGASEPKLTYAFRPAS